LIKLLQNLIKEISLLRIELSRLNDNIEIMFRIKNG